MQHTSATPYHGNQVLALFPQERRDAGRNLSGIIFCGLHGLRGMEYYISWQDGGIRDAPRRLAHVEGLTDQELQDRIEPTTSLVRLTWRPATCGT